MRILGSAMKALPFILTLPLAEVVDMSAEKGCGIWARAKELNKNKMPMAKVPESLCFTVVFSPENVSIKASYTPNSTIHNWQKFTIQNGICKPIRMPFMLSQRLYQA